MSALEQCTEKYCFLSIIFEAIHSNEGTGTLVDKSIGYGIMMKLRLHQQLMLIDTFIIELNRLIIEALYSQVSSLSSSVK